MAINVAETYERYGPMVLRRCRMLLRDEHKARDAMHEVFVKLIERQQDLTDAYPSSLLYRMATNHCLNLMARKAESAVKCDPVLLDCLAQDGRVEARAENLDTLALLFRGEKESTREIAVLHYVDGLTLEQAAREVGLSVSGVRQRLRILRERALRMRRRSDA